MKVVGICGSLRDGTYTRHAVKLALEGAREAGAETTLFDPQERPLPFCYQSDAPAEWEANAQEWCRLLRECDGVILGTPEYHGSVSGVLKNALDLAGFDEFTGKVCGMVSVLGGQANANALNHLRIILRWVHAWVVPHQAAIGGADNAFDDAGNLKDAKLQARVKRVGEDVVKYAKLLRTNPELAKL